MWVDVCEFFSGFKELANLSLGFRDFKDKNMLWCMYLKVENNKYPLNKVLRS